MLLVASRPGSERLRAYNLPAVHPSSLLAVLVLLLLLLLMSMLLSLPEERDRRSEVVEGCNDKV